MLTSFVQNLLRRTDNPIIIELGACDARYTQQIFMCCERGVPTIYSFEPDPRNLEHCMRAMPPIVKFIPAAVGNVTGRVSFHLAAPQPNGEIGSSSISPFKDVTKAFPWCKEVGNIQVECWRLDDFCEAFGVREIDLIFMDIQGAERLMIEGAPKTLEHTRFLWTEFEGVDTAGTLYEHSSSLKELHSMLPGWEIVEIVDGDALLRNTKICS
jgi:FkbM family methyltransferase